MSGAGMYQNCTIVAVLHCLDPNYNVSIVTPNP